MSTPIACIRPLASKSATRLSNGTRITLTQSQRTLFSSQSARLSTNRLQLKHALNSTPSSSMQLSSQLRLFSSSTPARASASSEEADKIMEEIQDLYLMAKDEFEIAYEETTKNTVYAEADREAAVAELKTLKDAYDAVLGSETVSDEVKAEVKKRAGTRIRELEAGVERMLEEAMEHD